MRTVFVVIAIGGNEEAKAITAIKFDDLVSAQVAIEWLKKQGCAAEYFEGAVS